MRNQLSDGRITLRAYQPGDAEALLEAVLESMAELRPFMPWAHEAYGLADAQQFIGRCLDLWSSGGEYNFAVIASGSGQYLGGASLHALRPQDRVGEIGYWVRSSRAGQGVASAATRLLARLGFDDLGLERIEILLAAHNLASRRVAEKAGAALEGRLSRRLRLVGQQHDAFLFALTRPG